MFEWNWQNPIKKEVGNIICGDALKVLPTLQPGSVDMLITSPPYWSCRDYGVEEQLGREETYEEYLDKLLAIFNEARRVLKEPGSVWVNIGDVYSSGNNLGNILRKERVGTPSKKLHTSCPKKSLIGLPMRFCIKMIDNGWILRNTIIWHKPNCVPISCKDRFTTDFEYLYFFTKRPHYYFEQQLEPSIWASRDKRSLIKGGVASNGKSETGIYATKGAAFRQDGMRNKRAVWTINTQPHREAHYAVYPEELCRIPISACCPEFICDVCGQPKLKKYSFGYRGATPHKGKNENSAVNGTLRTDPSIVKEVLYEECSCKATFHPGIVLDPFFGIGTTGVVAKHLGRNFLGIDINPEYCRIAEERIA
jgi:site-specific DNA-methyltransferase (adenine-specific)